MSALVVLTSDVYLGAFSVGADPIYNGAALSSTAYGEALPYVGSIVISIATIFFALSTILGWAYYGEVCAMYLFKAHQKNAVLVYRLVYVAFVFVGAVAEIGVIWLIADCFNALMALPNLIALVTLSKVVIDTTAGHFRSRANADNEAINNEAPTSKPDMTEN
jgi:AGCS family alanine or glycine:cation symporter